MGVFRRFPAKCYHKMKDIQLFILISKVFDQFLWIGGCAFPPLLLRFRRLNFAEVFQCR